MTFTQKLFNAVTEADSSLCVGLDPNPARIPQTIKEQYAQPHEQVLYFLKRVIEITAPCCAAYKPNLAFFEALGRHGLTVFEKIISIIPENKIIIADAKRGDVSSTAKQYARAYFEKFDVDAITLNPLMGFETLHPFLEYPEKGIYLLTLTSNPGAADFLMQPFGGQSSMAAHIAKKSAALDNQFGGHVGMVVGATKTGHISAVIRHHPEAALLIPGMGVQGGIIDGFNTILKNHKGIPLFSASRSILYAGESAIDWETAIEKKVSDSKNELNSVLKANV